MATPTSISAGSTAPIAWDVFCGGRAINPSRIAADNTAQTMRTTRLLMPVLCAGDTGPRNPIDRLAGGYASAVATRWNTETFVHDWPSSSLPSCRVVRVWRSSDSVRRITERTSPSWRKV